MERRESDNEVGGDGLKELEGEWKQISSKYFVPVYEIIKGAAMMIMIITVRDRN